MFSAEGIGKTIEKAIENALLELKASRDDVDIKILNEGGLFKKAKVLVTISDDAIEKYKKREEKRNEEKRQTETNIEKNIPSENISQNKDIEQKQEIKENVENINTNKEDIDTNIIEDNESLKNEVKSFEKRVEKNIDALEFLKGFFEKAGKTVEIEIKEDEKYITYIVKGEELGDLIGHRGESFYAISRLVNAICNSNKKILLDIGGFREKRVESLTELAYRVANKVAKSGRYYKLDPMNPSDRRIIHTALQNDDRVTTLSKGTEPKRYVIVFPKDND